MTLAGKSRGGRPRVCVLTSVHPPLDVRVFHRQARSTSAAGFEVTLIAPGAPNSPVDGVKFKSLPSWGGRWGRPFRWPILFWKALRTRADIYHLHDPELLPWALLLKWTTRRPVVYDSHEFLRENMLSKDWIPPRLRNLLAAVMERIERTVARRIDAVVAVTDDMADRFRPVQRRVVTVRNLPPAPELPAGPAAQEPVIAYAGVMRESRGLSILYETARRVHESHPEAEFHILGVVRWTGLPSEQNRTNEEWEAVGVRFLGTVPPSEVPPFLAKASIGWLPRDPSVPNNLLAWPNKLVEYMVVGLPVVASDLPLQAAVVTDADCGYAVEGLSPEAHADAICELLADPARARSLGENGRRVALQKYTWEAEARKLIALYEELLGNGPSPSVPGTVEPPA